MSSIVYRLSQFTVLAAVVVLVYGGLTTSFRAGMADPVWPTHPLFLFIYGENYDYEKDRAFLLEHNHRRFGFTLGAAASVLALAAWMTGPNKKSRLIAIITVCALLSSYGDLHKKMTDAWKLRQAGEGFTWPHASIAVTLAAAAILIFVAFLHLRSKQSGKWVRFWASLILIAVMIQGLLGGLRVFLDSELGISRTLGVELAAMHGVFAQLVFSALVCIPILCRPNAGQGNLVPPLSQASNPLGRLSFALVGAVFLQLIFAAWIRHAPTAVGQRLHLLTAFAVVGIAVWLCLRINSQPASRRVFKWYAVHLLVMLAVQVLLGVEAWMGKFSAQGPQGMKPPELRDVTTGSAIIRTLHQLIGTAILASSVALALRIWRKPSPTAAPGGFGVAIETTVAKTNPNEFGIPA